MPNIQTIEELYRVRNEWLPDDLQNEVGHFNIFRLDPEVGKGAKPSPYRKHKKACFLKEKS